MSTYFTGSRFRPHSEGGALFVILGLVWIVLGVAAITVPGLATFWAVTFLGVLLIVGGVLHCVHAFMTRGGEGFLLQLLEGLLSLFIGAVLLADPVGGAIGLTLLIGIFLLAGGVLRGVLAFAVRRSAAWVWLLVSGVLELILGVIILMGWPGTAT